MENFDEIILGEIYEIEIGGYEGNINDIEIEYDSIDKKWYIEVTKNQEIDKQLDDKYSSENYNYSYRPIEIFLLSTDTKTKLGRAILYINNTDPKRCFIETYFTLYLHLWTFQTPFPKYPKNVKSTVGIPPTIVQFFPLYSSNPFP